MIDRIIKVLEANEYMGSNCDIPAVQREDYRNVAAEIDALYNPKPINAELEALQQLSEEYEKDLTNPDAREKFMQAAFKYATK